MFQKADSRDGRKMPPRLFHLRDVPDYETLGLQLTGTDENGEEREHDHGNKDRQERYTLASRPASLTEEETECDERNCPRGLNNTCWLRADSDGAQVVGAGAP